jgi:hypothetical protein
VHVQDGDSNISIGSNPSVMADFSNLVVGSGKDQSRNIDGTLSDRMDGTECSVVIGNGCLRGIGVGTSIERTSIETKVPDFCILLGSNATIPTDIDGLPDPNTDGHLILGSGEAEGSLQAAGGVVNGGLGQASIPIWYNGTRYVLQANAQAAPP